MSKFETPSDEHWCSVLETHQEKKKERNTPRMFSNADEKVNEQKTPGLRFSLNSVTHCGPVAHPRLQKKKWCQNWLQGHWLWPIV